jgi:hypothetical protein
MSSRKTGPVIEPTNIVIKRVGTERLLIPIVGTAPLIVHRWSEKARRELLESQQGIKKVKTPLDPQAEYEASSYRIQVDGQEETYGFPALGFKAATVETFRFFDKSVTKVMLQQSLFFKGVFSKSEPMSLVKIEGDPEMREDIVTVGMGTQPRYRATFIEWRATLDVRYVTATLNRDTVLNLVDSGGSFVGGGEWRPEKSGESGTYEVDESRPLLTVGHDGQTRPVGSGSAVMA